MKESRCDNPVWCGVKHAGKHSRCVAGAPPPLSEYQCSSWHSKGGSACVHRLRCLIHTADRPGSTWTCVTEEEEEEEEEEDGNAGRVMRSEPGVAEDDAETPERREGRVDTEKPGNEEEERDKRRGQKQKQNKTKQKNPRLLKEEM